MAIKQLDEYGQVLASAIITVDLIMAAIHYSMLTMVIPLDAYGSGIYLPSVDVTITFMHIIMLVIAAGAIVSPALAWFIYFGKKEAEDPDFYNDSYKLMFRVASLVYLSCLVLEFVLVNQRYAQATTGPLSNSSSSGLDYTTAFSISIVFLAINFLFSMVTGRILHAAFSKKSYAS